MQRLRNSVVYWLLMAPSAVAAPQNWVVAWAAPPAHPGTLASSLQTPGALRNRTVRNIVHLAIGGTAVRIRVSNVLGTEPLAFDTVTIGFQQHGAVLAPHSNRPVTFGGDHRVTIPEGAIALSDPVPMALTAGQNLAISLFSANAGGSVTTHPAAFQDNFVGSGNLAAANEGAGFSQIARSWFFLSAVEVLAAPAVRGAIVTFGDSITDGDGSSINANRRWPDVLARRANGQFAVVNAAISGNRLLSSSPCFGPAGLARLERDALSFAGVRAIIVLAGVNDLIHHDVAAADRAGRLKPCTATAEVSADELITAYKQLAARVHGRGLKIFAGTILPFEGFPVWTKATEAKRQTINTWIKTGGVFDGVVDFASAVAEPRAPSRLARNKDSGDHLHPNDAGYAAMANALDLAMLVRGLQQDFAMVFPEQYRREPRFGIESGHRSQGKLAPALGSGGSDTLFQSGGSTPSR
jgi:lysophospholipase L1-like esterase